MKATNLAVALAGGLWLLGPLAAQQPGDDQASLDAQLKAAQTEVTLATLRLGLVQAQMRLKEGQLDQARRELDQVRAAIEALGNQMDLSVYRKLADKLQADLARRPRPQARAADVAETAGPAGPGYGDPRITMPGQPGLDRQVDLAVEQANLARANAYTNVPGSRTELATDPETVRQRTLDHQQLWDAGRYAPARELIDVGRMMELERERLHFQGALATVRGGARTDQMLHTMAATVPPQGVLDHPDNQQQIAESRARYRDGKLWESQPFKDADGKAKTVAVYDVADLLFVPIFPGPSEYNLNRPRNLLSFWLNQPGYFDLLLWGPLSGPRGAYGGAGFNPTGSYMGYHAYDIIPPYYFPYEADPIYQYRLAQKRARLLQQVNAMLSTVKD